MAWTAFLGSRVGTKRKRNCSQLLLLLLPLANHDEIRSKSDWIVCSDVQAEEARNEDYDDHDADDVKNIHCTLRLRDREKKPQSLCGIMYLPAAVTDTDAQARDAEANAGARLVVIVVTAPLDVLLAGSIVVRIAVALLDEHARRSTGSVATAGVIANQAHLLRIRLVHAEIGGVVGKHVGSHGAVREQNACASQECNTDLSHG